ncbi:uncharacterized protein BDZ99DRAFT_555153 [Mytilinidion resinicola]|uniref:Uncharacterized protein n=1 Tax=Mytilinidion resinicola TaxID=574789 RepID=A0A6A6Z164_9PEZI|nr:uncharacterized protein BDZ99DRAFT_555153 [Mytilinidion resinicola]KAF2814459.1 hypothetical protein BDZ99DRAFT_555153 [Mytilinidion resinicola]
MLMVQSVAAFTDCAPDLNPRRLGYRSRSLIWRGVAPRMKVETRDIFQHRQSIQIERKWPLPSAIQITVPEFHEKTAQQQPPPTERPKFRRIFRREPFKEPKYDMKQEHPARYLGYRIFSRWVASD